MRNDIYKHYKKSKMKGDEKLIDNHPEVIFEKDTNNVYDSRGNYIGKGEQLDGGILDITFPKAKEILEVKIEEEPVPVTEKEPIFGNLKKDNDKK